MASAAGSDIFALIALLVISLAVLLLLRYFLPLRSTPSFLTVPVFLALALPASIILLVPIDLASSTRVEDEASKGIWLNGRVVLVSWRISYWLTFMLTWVVLPLLGEYMDAGYRDPKHRLLYSLRSNGRYQLIVLTCAIAGLVYMIISNGFNFTAIKALVMALAYVWGLILAVYLMGHGLVALPRRMFRNASTSGRLRRIQGQAPKVREKLDDAIAKLQDFEAQVFQLKQRKTGTARDFQEWIDELADTSGLPESRPSTRTMPSDAEIQGGAKVPAIITERYMADLSRRLARARHQKARFVEEWDRIVQVASDFQAILDSKASKKLSFGRSIPESSLFHRYSPLTPYLRFLLHTHIFPAVRIALGAVFTLASLAIVWSEIIRFPAPQLSAVSLTVVHHPSNEDYEVGLGGQFLAAAWICYMCVCALSSVNDVPVWNQRALVRRNTYSESACWYAGQIAKLTVPLSYNFLTFLPRHIHQNTTFYQFLGRLINLTPLGTGFDYFFPIFILLPVCAALFNLYSKIKTWFGFELLEDEDDSQNPSGYGTGSWREGRDLIARDLEGPGASVIGLLDSPRPSADLDPAERGTTPRWTPPSDWQTATTPSATRSNGLGTSRRELDPEPEQENFLTLFGRRVKNTVDAIETPRWMQNNASGLGVKKPKWMSSGGGNNAGPASQPSRNTGTLFGSRSSNGQITL